MKKLILFLAIVLSCGIAHADNSARIKELSDEGQKLVTSLQQYVSAQKQIESRLNEINGALKELSAQDEAAKTKTKK